MEIKLYEDRYRDDMIFMVLQAKDAPEEYRVSTKICSISKRITLTVGICFGSRRMITTG